MDEEVFPAVGFVFIDHDRVAGYGKSVDELALAIEQVNGAATGATKIRTGKANEYLFGAVVIQVVFEEDEPAAVGVDDFFFRGPLCIPVAVMHEPVRLF